jgi:hypothetical protein
MAGANMKCIGDDAINTDIWRLSRTIQLAILQGKVGTCDAQQVMPKPEHRILFGPDNPLPWVPDLVGAHFSEGQGVLVVGSSYNGFITGYSARKRTMNPRTYADCRDNETSGLKAFTEEYLRSVVVDDEDYYGPILRQLSRMAGIEPEQICLTDLCKASFVERGRSFHVGCRGDIGNDSVVRNHWERWTRYIQESPDIPPATCAPYRWIWGRIQQAKTIIALGTIAEYGILKVFYAMAATPRVTSNREPNIRPDAGPLRSDRPWKYAYACPTRKLRDWLTVGDWWRLEAGPSGPPRRWSLLPVYHPAVVGRQGDTGYSQASALLARMIQESESS